MFNNNSSIYKEIKGKPLKQVFTRVSDFQAASLKLNENKKIGFMQGRLVAPERKKYNLFLGKTGRKSLK